MKKKIAEEFDEARVASLDDSLKAGGFKRAKNPKGALQRSRTDRDARKQPPEPRADATGGKNPGDKSSAQIEVMRAPDWNFAWLVHGFSTRTGGCSTAFGGHDLNLEFTAHDEKGAVEKNRSDFLAEVTRNTETSKPAKKTATNHKAPDAKKFTLVATKQIHSDVIHVIGRDHESGTKIVGDGLITSRVNVLLSMQTADCVPVLLVDVRRKAVGAFHAGWRGTVKRIVEKGIGMMRMEFGSEPKDIHAAIGPCIAQCCYAVGDEVIDQFHSQFSYARSLFREVFDDDPVKQKYPLLFMTARAPGHSNIGPQKHLDLVEANRRQLLEAGVGKENIWTSGLCTSCNVERLFSHRKEGGFTGRMMVVVGIRQIGN